MSEQYRFKGRFAKKKVVERRLKALASMNQRRTKRKSEQQSENSPKENQVPTLRDPVNVNELEKNLHCSQCHKVLSLRNVTKEKHDDSDVNCEDCLITKKVSANKLHKTKNDVKHSDNSGIEHADADCTGLDKILACVDAPISNDLYRRYKRKYGPMIEKAEEESRQRRAKEEQQLIKEKLEQLCKNKV